MARKASSKDKPEQALPPPATASDRWEALKLTREPFLRRARECAKLTIPSVMPPEAHSPTQDLPQPFQSVGADGANNLASKLHLVLFPPGTPFFRFGMDDFVVDAMLASAGPGEDPKAEFELALAKCEKAVTARMEMVGSRKTQVEALLHLVITGNGLVHVLDDCRQKFFGLDRYVVSRDLSGNVLEIITQERLAKASAPPEGLQLLDAGHEEQGAPDSEDKTIELYTWVRRQPNGSWKVHQECCGRKVPNSDGSYPKDKSPWLPLRWTSVSGEAYGRGRAEEYLGDLSSYEVLQQAIVEFAAAASKILFLVNEGGTTQKRILADAPSGSIVDGDARDITVLMLEKSQDFNVARAVGEDVKNRLERAFLLASAVQRNAERVTAEEIRAVLAELDQGIGGVYSILAEEYQRPLITYIWHRMQRSGDLPTLPDKTVRPQIITGLEGLGRNSDLQRLDIFLAGIAQTFGPEAVGQWVNVGAYMKRRAAALGITLDDLVRTDEEVQQQQQQAQTMDMVGKLGPQAISTMGKAAMTDQQPPQE